LIFQGGGEIIQNADYFDMAKIAFLRLWLAEYAILMRAIRLQPAWNPARLH
jgi:hypothetical protein